MIDYKNIFNFNEIPKKSINNLSDLKNNFLKKNKVLPVGVNQNQPGVSGDLFSLLNDLDINKKESQQDYNNNNYNSNSLVPNMLLIPTKQILQPHAKNGPLHIPSQNKQTSFINSKSENSNSNSYIDFVKSLGWENSSGTNFNNIPHLDIYFMNKVSDQDRDSNQHMGNFLEMEEKTKYFSPDYQYINKVNNPKNGYLWKAKVYDDFVGKSYDQMRNLLGNINFPKHLISNTIEDSDSQPNNSLLELEINISHQEESKTKSKLKNHYEKLPENFDWRNVDGANYDSPIRKQGECGSCYAIAAVSVLEARIRIKSNNRLKPLLSAASIISCSRYNQGCAGGYPYLVGKHGKEFGFVEEGCQPYTESDDKCYNYCFHQKAWKIRDYG
jgi:C1A family cysteine protease